MTDMLHAIFTDRQTEGRREPGISLTQNSLPLILIENSSSTQFLIEELIFYGHTIKQIFYLRNVHLEVKAEGAVAATSGV